MDLRGLCQLVVRGHHSDSRPYNYWRESSFGHAMHLCRSGVDCAAFSNCYVFWNGH
jgi:hypothetical protein